MNKINNIKKLIFLFAVLLIAFSATTPVAFADERISATEQQLYPASYSGYVFPLRPGTSAWSKLENHQKMVDVCQIPDEVLAKMPTSALVETILFYPLGMDMFAYDDVAIGYKVVAEHFNGLQELETRDDAAEELIAAYVDAVPAKVLRGTSEQVNDASGVYLLSALLGQDVYQQKMNKVDVDTLASLCSGISEPNEPDVLVHDVGTTATPVSFYAYMPYGGTPKTVSTPNKGSVAANYDSECGEVWVYSDGQQRVRYTYSDIPSTYKTEMNEYVEDTYGLTPDRQPTVKYNCHSYAWYSTSSSNKYWIDYPGAYLTDGSYDEVGKMQVEVGGRIVYYDTINETYGTPTHSAKITSIRELTKSKRNFTVISKWGMMGLYEHSWATCPYYYISKSPVDLKYFN